ncbi:MAG: hypothetical protein ACK55I_27265, partial [bacterium]
MVRTFCAIHAIHGVIEGAGAFDCVSPLECLLRGNGAFDYATTLTSGAYGDGAPTREKGGNVGGKVRLRHGSDSRPDGGKGAPARAPVIGAR